MNDEEPNAIEVSKDLEVTVCENGVVNIHRPDSDRAHSVFVDDGEAIRCSCKGHKYNGECVHQEEVSRRPLVLSSASAISHEVMTDGGSDDGGDTIIDDEGDERPARTEEPDFGRGPSGVDEL